MSDRAEGATGGGGGGGGRLRINTHDTDLILGLVSPSLSTSAATRGSLRRAGY